MLTTFLLVFFFGPISLSQRPSKTEKKEIKTSDVIETKVRKNTDFFLKKK